MMTNVSWIYCDDHFATYTNIESLCCAPETNMLCQVKLKKSIEK